MLVERERPLLDEIFGAGQYEIEESGSDVAIVRSAEFKLEIVYDRSRNRHLGLHVMLLGLPKRVPILVHPLRAWFRFLGKESDSPRLPTDASGIITTPPDEQLRNELKLFARYKQDVSSDPQVKQDAAFFAAGYSRAYNDWASRKGPWSEDS